MALSVKWRNGERLPQCTGTAFDSIPQAFGDALPYDFSPQSCTSSPDLGTDSRAARGAEGSLTRKLRNYGPGTQIPVGTASSPATVYRDGTALNVPDVSLRGLPPHGTVSVGDGSPPSVDSVVGVLDVERDIRRPSTIELDLSSFASQAAKTLHRESKVHCFPTNRLSLRVASNPKNRAATHHPRLLISCRLVNTHQSRTGRIGSTSTSVSIIRPDPAEQYWYLCLADFSTLLEMRESSLDAFRVISLIAELG